MIKDTRHETAVVKVLHAGSLNSLVQRGVGLRCCRRVGSRSKVKVVTLLPLLWPSKTGARAVMCL